MGLPMNAKRRRVALGILVAASLLALPAAVRVEASSEFSSQVFYELVLGIIEDPDPVPVVIWESRPVQEAEECDLCEIERTGVANDERPSVEPDPRTGFPAVVWARDSGWGRDIAFSHWTGTAWGGVEWVATGAPDDRDPRVYVDSKGTAWVVWWRDDSAQRIYLTRRPGRAAAWDEAELIEVGGQRPSILRADGELLLAYERHGAAGVREVALRYYLSDGSTYQELLAETGRRAPLDPVLHLEAGTIWIDWKHDDGRFAFRVLEGSRWSALQFLSWSDGGWDAEMEAREQIRSLVLAR